MDLPKRKPTRLKNYDYSSTGAYFITICTKNRKEILSKIDVGTGVPTRANSIISRFISTFKRFCNKKYGQNIWQDRSNDHIVRGENDYQRIWEYIDKNPIKWKDDSFYSDTHI